MNNGDPLQLVRKVEGEHWDHRGQVRGLAGAQAEYEVQWQYSKPG